MNPWKVPHISLHCPLNKPRVVVSKVSIVALPGATFILVSSPWTAQPGITSVEFPVTCTSQPRGKTDFFIAEGPLSSPNCKSVFGIT